MFDLYGDHLPAHGHWAPIAGVVALLHTCGIAPAATRTAVSRMVAQHHLVAQTRDRTRGYAATPATRLRLGQAHRRIYRREPVQWDGSWHVVTVERATDRAARDRVAATLGYLGYGRLSAQTWIAPRRSPEVAEALAPLRADPLEFTATHAGDPTALVHRVWDLAGLAQGYRDFSATAAAVRQRATSDLEPHEAYPLRADLVHRWRTFLFVDPDLPDAVLPPDWPERPARALFLHVADLLLPAARRFVADTLAAAGAGPTTQEYVMAEHIQALPGGRR